ncbi:hypothetical protein L2E82_25019 [Cichorium intybus]|uniref:Uncharacterized protein n=1 Tax=Cichorium intybus TaxID=13427 RepID=A0ACB9E2M8_CICIN|nr:hypothetical protein L2E82_25019 [Cichorium intybus]
MVFAKFAMLGGRHPPKFLFVKTTTEVVLDPKFEGITNINRLLLMKIVSRFLLKSVGGNAPSNPLKRRSRNLRLGRDMTTEWKGPTNRLLLRSSSKRRVRFDKVRGRMPQKQLLFRLRSARSDNKPSSSWRNLAMSAWFRLILATV